MTTHSTNAEAVTTNDYHSRPEVSSTMIKSMAKGWRTFEAEFIPRPAPRAETKSLLLGTAVHAALLEPERFAIDYVVCPEECSDRRTNAYKKWTEGIGDGVKVLTQDDADTIQRIKANVLRDEVANTLINKPGEVEKVKTWTAANGVECRLKLDKQFGTSAVLDIKTTQNALPWGFRSTLGEYRYDLQAAHYMEGTGAERFFFLVVETVCPWRVRTYQLIARGLAFAEQQRLRLLDEYKRRIVSGDWSERGENEVLDIDVPEYLRGDE